jgi:peptidoglycan/LPS O-acetylase OafA/YrhL
MNGAPVRGLRADIQALRGYAVLLVIAYHAGLGVAPAGFLGVDVFFVVSGFLIGGGVLRGLAVGDFAFGPFYLRRIRRLVPAAYAVLFAVICGGAWLLTASAYARFLPQALGALSYTTNLVLWRQINYFNTSAASEPLLHMWSLAIEEQFYLGLPLALWATPRRWRPWAIGAATVLSLAGYLVLYPRSPGLAFYALPTRAWELGLGALAALVPTRRLPRGVAAAAVMVLLAMPLVPVPGLAAYWLALPACVATALLLPGPGRRAGWLGPLARVGDASYSLYLVHWPLFGFAHVLWMGDPPCAVALCLLVATGVLGLALNRLVEAPGRWYPARARTVVLAYAGATAFLAAQVLAGGAVVKARGQPVDLRGVTGLDLPGCDADATAYDGRCTRVARPDVLVWGDSFSQALVPALESGGATRLAQASKGQCAPLLGIAPVDRDATATFAAGCLSFNRSVLAWLAATPSVRVVVLSGFYQRYAQAGTQALREGDSVLRPAGMDGVLAAQRRTVDAIRALGRRVVLVSGPVPARFDVGQCWERSLTRLPLFSPAPGCAIAPDGASSDAGWTARLLDRFVTEASTPVVRLDRLMCPQPGRCETIADGVPLYRDADHLSLGGARLVGRRFDLARRAVAAAR